VMLPPGWSRLETRPVSMGSALKPKTIGIVVVAAFAARIAGTLPDATRTATPRSTQSLAQSGSLPQWNSIAGGFPRNSIVEVSLNQTGLASGF